MTPAQKAVRKRLYDDYEYYAAKALKVRTKPDAKGVSRIAPFKLNRAQRKLLDVIIAQLERRGFVRLIIVKGRQMGSSTFVEGFIYWWTSQRPAQRALVVAHDAPATQTVFEMTKRFHDNCPAVLQPSTKYSGKKELTFDILDSSYRVATAGGEGIVRGDMINSAHLSEFAWWPPGSAKANFNGLMDAIPNTVGTICIIESTSNGFNLFYEQWRAANEGDSLFETIFLSWLLDDGYRLPLTPGFERSPKEQEIVDLYGATDEQLMFRRAKVAEKGMELFRQEYPFTAEESFLTSGRPVFNPDRIAELLRSVREPIALKSLEGKTFVDHPLGELRCFLPFDEHETYYIGGDVGAGVRQDASVAQVLDSRRRQAAVWRSDRVDPDYFGTTLAALGRFYNSALICCERNQHGILTNRVIAKDEGYPFVFRETVYDKITDTETTHVGFFTSEKSKPFVVDKLRAHVREREIEVYDLTTLQEMQQFIVTPSGRMEAEKGQHDDTVIALALADHVNDGPFSPITNEDAWYGSIE